MDSDGDATAVRTLSACISYSVSEEVGWKVSEEMWSQVAFNILDEEAADDTVHTAFS